MGRKRIIILICIISIILAMIVSYFRNKKNITINQYKTITNLNEIPFDEETELYYIKDEETGEIIGASKNKKDLQIYIDNPDYNPNPLITKKQKLEDFLSEEEIIEK